jgi:hypothetical protein
VAQKFAEHECFDGFIKNGGLGEIYKLRQGEREYM